MLAASARIFSESTRAANRWLAGAGLDPARISFGPTRKRGASARLGSAEVRLGAGVVAVAGTTSRRPASQPTRPSRPAVLKALPPGQARGQRCRGPDRIAAHCEADSEPWTGVTAARRAAGLVTSAGEFQTGRPATRDLHHPASDGSRPLRAAQPTSPGLFGRKSRASRPRDHELDRGWYVRLISDS